MKATEAKLLATLKTSPQFVIPIYQRTYSWTSKECRQLWDDIIRAGQNDSIAVHFLGSIVYVEKSQSNNAVQSPQLVIDGQQRLTTVILIIAALADALGDKEPVAGFSAKKLRNWYLLNPEEDLDRRYKLLLSQTDKSSLNSIVDEHELPTNYSRRISENYKQFVDLIDTKKDDFEALCNGLAKLMIVDIALTRGQDNPQLIFESMNSTGRKLTQADLIRNFVLMGLEPKLQTRLYEQCWRPMELAFGQEAYDTHFDYFVRHYLTHKTGDIPRLNQVYEAFKNHAQSKGSIDEAVEPLIKDLRDYARYFCKMALGDETDIDLKEAFHDLRELKIDVAYPFLLELYHDYAMEKLDKEDFLQAVRLVEAYVFRRAISAIPTNSLNKTFATFTKSLKKDRYLESIKAHFLTMPSYRRFPKNDEFERDMQTRDLYNFRSRSYWLRRFENYGRKERVPVDEYTIEHIMPQNEKVSNYWKDELGEEWSRIHETWLHTLGNLTLTGYNSEYSDKSFAEKRDMEGGFKFSPLKVNEGLGEVTRWDEHAIKFRADKLAKTALNVWAAPNMSGDVLSTYQTMTSLNEGCTIEDHPYLLSGPMKILFEVLRTEILALDPCVTEEFLKRYVAYKAETNFTDIVPQKKQLRISLNMPFGEINDPKDLCKDVSGVGRWGNGEVEFQVNDTADIPYAMGLIRQSLERQLGDEANI